VTDLMAYKGYAVAEVGGRNREEAIKQAFALMDRFHKRRKSTAEERYEVYQVRDLSHVPGLHWWAVHYRPKRRVQ